MASTVTTIQTQPAETTTPDPPPTTGDSSTGPIGRVVAASVVAGLVGALVLTLLVFAGGPEHVLTGAALLAFASGWAMLGVLSLRMTSQPQRWAFVPAAAMGLVGATLVVLAPGDDDLRRLGWVWPPLLLALAGWMTVAARRHLPGRTRVLALYPIFAFLTLGGLGGGYETVRLSLDRRAYPMPGKSYDVGGHRLHLHCRGTGGPTVVLENGMGETAADWAWVAPAAATDTRVCAYDRAGQGWSGDAGRPQDGLAIAADLHTLLDRAHEPGPYVLVGHSSGGAYALTYAARYPTEVAGVVLLDATSPDAFTLLPAFPATYSAMRRFLAVAPSLGRLGAWQLAEASTGSTLPAPAKDQVHAFATSPRGLRSGRDEIDHLPTSLTQARALTDLAGKPLAVVTAGQGQQAGWSNAQDRLATLSTNSVHRVAHATHQSLLADRSDSAGSVQAVADVVRSVRSSSPLPAR